MLSVSDIISIIAIIVMILFGFIIYRWNKRDRKKETSKKKREDYEKKTVELQTRHELLEDKIRELKTELNKQRDIHNSDFKDLRNHLDEEIINIKQEFVDYQSTNESKLSEISKKIKVIEKNIIQLNNNDSQIIGAIREIHTKIEDYHPVRTWLKDVFG